MNDSNPAPRTGYVLIKGITEEGKRFRPSDWAERLATAVGRFGADRRIHFHPRVRMVDLGEGKCVIVDVLLEREEPHLFQFLMHFATSNRLKIETDHVRAPMRAA